MLRKRSCAEGDRLSTRGNISDQDRRQSYSFHGAELCMQYNALSKSYTCYGAETHEDGREAAHLVARMHVAEGVDEVEDREDVCV